MFPKLLPHRSTRVVLALVVALVAASWFSESAAAASSYAAGSKVRVLVRFRDGTSSARIRAVVGHTNAVEKAVIRPLGVHVLLVPARDLGETLRALRASRFVRYAERDRQVRDKVTIPNDPYWVAQWAPASVNAPAAWDLTTGAPSTIVAVLDSGVDFSQPDLQGAFVQGRDIVNKDDDPSDDYGHGTYVAGIVGARTNNALGVASYCWRCSVMPVKVLGSSGWGYVSDVAAGITWATDHGARVISMSLGDASANTSTLANAVKYAHDRGVVLTAAAGNESSSTKEYPAAYPEVLAVAASQSTDTLYSWSEYGSWVEVAAPGCNYTTGRNSWYGSFCGTSSATPVVAGLAGLAFSYAPWATNVQVEQALEGSAVPIANVEHGRIDAWGTLTALGGGSATPAAAPVNTSLPTISGTPEEGQALTASTGEWSGSPTGYSYQWRRCDSGGAACGDIGGATGETYTATLADVGSTLCVQVTATNSAGSVSASSAASAPVAAKSATTTTATYTGSLNRKRTSMSFSLAVGRGETGADLSFVKASKLTLTISDASGATVASITGPSVVELRELLSGGVYSFVVSGTDRSSFTLAVTYTNP